MARLLPALSASAASLTGSGKSSGDTLAINDIVGATAGHREIKFRSGVESGADQVAKLIVGDPIGIGGAELDGPSARLELWVACDEPSVAALVPAVNRDTMFPYADEEATAADLVGRDLVGEHHRGVGMRFEDQPLQAVEQGPVARVDGAHVFPHPIVHCSIIFARGKTLGRPVA